MPIAKYEVAFRRFDFQPKPSAAEQDISNRTIAAILVRALQLETGEPANRQRVQQVHIDAGGSVARPESTIPIKLPRYSSGTQGKKSSSVNGRKYQNPVTYKIVREFQIALSLIQSFLR